MVKDSLCNVYICFRLLFLMQIISRNRNESLSGPNEKYNLSTKMNASLRMMEVAQVCQATSAVIESSCYLVVSVVAGQKGH